MTDPSRPGGSVPGPSGTTTGGAPGRSGTTGVGLASLVAAASGYLVLVLAARVLDPAQNADFLAFWGLLFFLFGTLGGLQSEVTRSAHVARTALSVGSTATVEPGGSSAPTGARIMPVALGVGTALAVLTALTGPLWGRAALGDLAGVGVAVVAVAVLAFAGHSAVAGTLAGRGRWSTYALVVAAEAVVRLGLVALVVVTLTDGLPAPLRVATGAAAGTWLAMSLIAPVRGAWGQRADVPARRLLSGFAHAMTGAAASAALVVGFPVLLRLTTDPTVYAGAAPLILAVQLTRAPLLIPLTAYQGMAITAVLTHRDRGLRPLVRVAGLVLAAGVLAAGAAALLGPWLMEVLLGPDYRVAGGVLAALTMTAALLALLTLTGAAALALDGHRPFAVGWGLATAVSAATLLLPGPLAVRIALSLATGPLVGLAVHVAHVRGALSGRR